MIPNNKKHIEKMKQSKFIPKPKGGWWFDDQPNPEGMGLHHMQKPKNKRKKK